MFSKIKNFLVEFSNTTTVHGINYFVDRSRHWIERTFWVVVFLISMAFCVFLVHDTYIKWQSSPIIVTQDDKLTSFSEIPFPAVTICSASKIKIWDPTNLTKNHDLIVDVATDIVAKTESLYNLKDFKFSDSELKAMSLTDEDLLLLEAVNHICPNTNNVADYIPHKLSPKEVVSTLKEYALGPNEMFAYHYLKSGPGGDIFTTVLTEEGLCTTFNHFDSFKRKSLADDYNPYIYESRRSEMEWNPEDGYKDMMDDELSPLRAFPSNPRDGLKLALYQEVDVTATGCPWSEDKKMKIVIHSPVDFPQPSHKFISVPTSGELVIGVKPVMMTSSPELSKYSVETRQCYFNSDRSLKFFKFYSQANCEFECLTNFTLMACGCVRVAMPRDNITRICGLSEITCVDTAKTILNLKNLDDLGDWETQDLMKNFNVSSKKVEELLLHSCNCLPPCVSLNYEITVLPIHDNDNARAEVNPNWTESRVMVHFQDGQFLKTKRSEIYGWEDFIANCGGLLGLFMGISILSIVELIYFATLRLACTLKSSKIDDEETAIENMEAPAIEKTLHVEMIDWDKF